MPVKPYNLDEGQAPLSARENSPRPEPKLRTKILDGISRIDACQLENLKEVFETLGVPGVEPGALKAQILNSVRDAELSEVWSGGNERGNARIGFYCNDSEYHTFLLHEIGHNVLQRLHIKTGYNEDVEPEERFCWEFSRRLCKILDLKFDEELARIGIEFALLPKIRDMGERMRRASELMATEKLLREGDNIVKF